MDVVRMVLTGQINRDLVSHINQHGPLAAGLSGEDAGLFQGRRRGAMIDGEIVDLGLVVQLRFEAGMVSLKLTFTAMGCPAMDMIMDDIRSRLGREPGVESIRIEVVWEPIWTKSRLTEDGKCQLREAGISV